MKSKKLKFALGLFLLIKWGFSYAGVLTFNIEVIGEKVHEELLDERYIYKQPVLNVINDLDEAMSLLSGRLTLSGDMLEVRDAKGNRVIDDIDYRMYEFIAYYPEEKLIQLEGPHQTDWIFSIDTGLDIDDVPMDRIYSPNNQYRLSYFNNGQGALPIIQKKVDTHWVTLEENFEEATDDELYSLFMIKEFVWIKDNTFIFTNYTGKYYYATINL
ncbi:hypothetical protein [Photobacterium nomapromontoriensis]|uniref:hypothetical protein n=1 Tax=Photobacterium nomapromontoriensis TaxID=2910237 RepID=UPI003D115997